MPIYEYKCGDCGKNFEYLVFGKDKPNCPSCDSENVGKKISVCGFMSKSSGGETVKSSASDSSCGTCTATNCSTCGL